MTRNCLICSTALDTGNDYHPTCEKEFFGMLPAPKLEMTLHELQAFAAQEVQARITVTGVQKKLSLGIEGKGVEKRFTIVGLWGRFILKPPSEEYPLLPENENVVMRLAQLFGIPVVPHALIRLGSGEIAFICKRIDRTKQEKKLAMEDFCQISERLTEDKYKGSVERVGKLIRRFSLYPGLDVVDFFERLLFCFITGNADMHLKNYSLIETGAGLRLSPAYDLLSTALALPEDNEESALTINGKKNGLKKSDFDALASALEIPSPATANIYRKFLAKKPGIAPVIEESFLPRQEQERFIGIIEHRYAEIF